MTAESATGTIGVTIYDADSGQPLSSAHLGVQLYRHGEAENSRSLLCVPSDDAQPRFTFDTSTDQNGSLTLTAPGGGYVAKITIPERQPVFGCVFFDTEAAVRACGANPSSLRLRQYAFVRATNSIPGFSGDIVGNSACAPLVPSACEPLRVPNRVETDKITLCDFEGSPIRNARLEFHEYTKAKGKLIARLATDANGVADVSGLVGSLRMLIESQSVSGEYIIQFTKGGKPGQQTIKMFHWRCRGELMQGAMVER